MADKRKVSVADITGALDVGTTEGLLRVQTMGERAKKAETIQTPQLGRPKVINADWERIQLRLPKHQIRAIKQAALDSGKTESMIVAEWIELSKF